MLCLCLFNIPMFWPRRRESVFLSTALPQELWNLQDDHCNAGTPKANQSRILNYQAVYFGVFFIQVFNKLEQLATLGKYPYPSTKFRKVGTKVARRGRRSITWGEAHGGGQGRQRQRWVQRNCKEQTVMWSGLKKISQNFYYVSKSNVSES